MTARKVVGKKPPKIYYCYVTEHGSRWWSSEPIDRMGMERFTYQRVDPPIPTKRRGGKAGSK